jgi:hypothetical protein
MVEQTLEMNKRVLDVHEASEATSSALGETFLYIISVNYAVAAHQIEILKGCPAHDKGARAISLFPDSVQLKPKRRGQ